MTTRANAARIGAVAVALLTVLVAASVRLVGEGRSELAASDAAWKNGDALGAAVHARSAARAYVPGAAHVDGGYERLRQIAESSEQRGDVESALFAWRAILSAESAARPFSSPSTETHAAAEASIARLSAALITSARTSSTARRAVPEVTLSGANTVPRLGWAALLLAGAALLCAAALRLASRAWGSDGRVVRAEVRVAVVMALAGLVAWIAGLLFA